MHRSIDPAILYFGTPVVLVSTLNEDGSANLAPMSSAWWIGRRCVLGLAKSSKTTENLLRTGECVLNLPSEREAEHVDRIAFTTGSDPVPEGKQRRGYRHEPDKFGRAGMRPVASETVAPPRALECPVHLEATLWAHHELAEDDPRWGGRSVAIETQIRKVHVAPDLLCEDSDDHIDPDRWRPLIMSFQQLYGLSPRLRDSRLASVPEQLYR